MTYRDVTKYLFSQLPMYQRQGKTAFKKDLKNILALCKILDDPHKKFKTIHVAGTNGKGSVSHMIAAALQEHGWKVGLYTSPHYIDYRERIKINGQLITEHAVIKFVEKYRKDFDQIQPSFFEITVAMAFDYFAQKKVDIAIIETGLGGRLDSTNIITPQLSIITNISLDHTSMLGNTLPEIAGEKAGIIKPNIPVLIGEYQRDDVFEVFEKKARETGSKLYLSSDIISFHKTAKNEAFQVWAKNKIWIDHIDIPQGPDYRIKNLKTSLAALYLCRKKWNLDPRKIASGIGKLGELTYYVGRWMKIGDEPKIFLDSAHNEAGVKSLIRQIKTMDYHQLHIIWGTVKDKDISQILDILPRDATYYWAKASIPRGLDAQLLENMARKKKLIGHIHASVIEAFKSAKERAAKNDLIIVAGSIFVVAEVLEYKEVV